jgi:hypothetical protein
MTGGNCLSSQIFQNKFSIGKIFLDPLHVLKLKKVWTKARLRMDGEVMGEGEA